MAKYSLAMSPTPCRVAVCIISIRPTYSCTHALTQLARAYKAGNISEKVVDRAKATINSLYKVVQWLLIAAK